MPVKKSVQNANNLLRKTFQKFRSICIGDYRTPPSFSCSSARVSKYFKTYELYNNDVSSNKSDFIVQTASCESCSRRSRDQTPQKCQKRKDNADKEKKKKNKKKKKAKGLGLRRGGEEELAYKMKELDMIDGGGDVEHVLDVEEALHYYSRLKSPEYLDIVDSFFMDMYHEFSLPQPSSSFNGSRRRFGSVGL